MKRCVSESRSMYPSRNQGKRPGYGLLRTHLIYAFAAPNGCVRPASIAGPMGRVEAFRRFMRQLLGLREDLV
jgi:hypothetical protein